MNGRSLACTLLAIGLILPAPATAAGSAQTKLTASDGNAADLFGTAVAVSGDTAVVGAPHETVGLTPHQGAVYVFTRTDGAWTQQAKLTAKDGSADDVLGARVSVSGDTALIASEGDDVGANPDQGSVYVFARNGGSWTEEAKLIASDGSAGDGFGFWVGLDDDTAVVGAFEDDVEAENQGSAYVFSRTGRRWTQKAHLTAPDGAAGDLFGRSVAVAGDTIVVGAQFDARDDTRAHDNDGSAYVFTRIGGRWTGGPKLTAPDAAGGLFGVCVAISGGTIVVGANFADVGVNVDQGAAYVVHDSSARPPH